MLSSNDQTHKELTPEQQAKVQAASEQDAKQIELSVEELEERIAPRSSRISV